MAIFYSNFHLIFIAKVAIMYYNRDNSYYNQKTEDI